MNIKIINGYLIVDGNCKVSATYNLFTADGIDICMPKEKQPEKPACQYPICQECHQFHDPALCCHQPKENRTMGRFDIATLLESLAKKFDETGCFSSGNVCRIEKENWK